MLKSVDVEAAQDLFIAIAKQALRDVAPNACAGRQAEAAEFLTFQIPDWRERWTAGQENNRGRKRGKTAAKKSVTDVGKSAVKAR